MSVDINLKMEDILNDYESALAKFENMEFLYNSHKDKFTIKDGDDDQTITRKKARLNELLVDLGRVGELTLKYIIKLAQIKYYPNQTYAQFQKEALFKTGPITSFAQRQKLSSNDIKLIKEYKDANDQKFHNFDYLFLIIEKTLPQQAANIYKIIEYSMQSREIQKNPLNQDPKENNEDIIFPEYIIRHFDDEEKDEETKEKIRKLRRDTISESGDIFTRLRYFSNNPHDKSFDLDSIYALMKDIITVIRTIHECNDDIDYDPIEGYGKIIALDNPNLTRYSKEELQKIINLFPTKTDPNGLAALLFFADKYTYEELKAITDIKQIDPADYAQIFINNLNAEEIKFFFKHGVTEYERMRFINTKKAQTKRDKLLASFGLGDKYTIEELEEIATAIEADKYNNVELFEYLTIKEIQEVNKHPKLLQLFLENLNIIFFIKRPAPYATMSEDLFIKLISIPEISEGKEYVLKSLYYHQLNTYRTISKELYKDPLLLQMINIENYCEDMIIDHVKENIKTFEQYEQLQGKLPYLLDPDDNKEILNILLTNGLNIDTVKELDSTIFYVPIRITKTIIDIMNQHNIPLIIDNQINNNYYKILTIILRKLNKKETFYMISLHDFEKYSDTEEMEQLIFNKS